MFVGSVNSLVRSVLWKMSADWLGRRVVVSCSGNFTVERIGEVNLYPGGVNLTASCGKTIGEMEYRMR